VLATSVLPCLSSANTLEVDTPISTEGYFVISWQLSDSTQNPTLQQSTSLTFTAPHNRQLTPQGSLTITGLPDGEYYFRLVDGEAQLSDPLQVTVEHHTLERAGLFFALGLVLFIILVATILRGAMQGDESHDG
jgi:hypothetical protein